MIRKAAALSILIASVSGCSFGDSASLNACEGEIKDRLLTASSYKRIEVKSSLVPMNLESWVKAHGHLFSADAINGTTQVGQWALDDGKWLGAAQHVIAYDAENAYGTPIRRKVTCVVPLTDKAEGSIKEDRAVIDGINHLNWLTLR